MNLKYLKINGGYSVVADGVRVGHVLSGWRRIYGGDCWHVSVGGERFTFRTRKEAAAYLARAAA